MVNGEQMEQMRELAVKLSQCDRRKLAVY